MKYILNKKRFKEQLVAKGYKNLLDFSRKTGVHRNTLQNLLSGKGILSSSFQSITDHLETDPLELMQPISTTKVSLPFIDEIRPLLVQLLKQDKKVAVVLLGSRAKKRAQNYSDWDLGVIRYPKPLEGIEFLRLKRWVGDLSEDLPRTVDLVNLNQAPDWFLKDIANSVLYLDGNKEAWIYLKGVLDGAKKEDQTA